MDGERVHSMIFDMAPYAVAAAVAFGAVAMWRGSDEAPVAAVPAVHAEALATGLRLVMVETPSCGWCKRFRREVAPGYPASEIGARMPLAYHDLTRGKPPLRLSAPVTTVPTFLVVAGDVEVGRLRGYPGGPDRFYPAMERLVDRAGRSRGGT